MQLVVEFIDSITEVVAHILLGAKILPIDRAIITFMLTEKQRVTAIQISSQTGGDGHPSFFEAEAGSFRDVGLNLLPLTLGLKINETADKIPPELETVEIDYIQGKLRLHSVQQR